MSIIPGKVPTYDPQWGAKTPVSEEIEVKCPVFPPRKNYTSLKVNLSGYNRQSWDNLYCTIYATDYRGLTPVERSVWL